jgi:hypothetical protein
MIRVEYIVLPDGPDGGFGCEAISVRTATSGGLPLIELKQMDDIIHLDPGNLDELIEALQIVWKATVQ